jgi:hypothetical protein
MLEVYVDTFMSLIIPVSREQIRHVATVVMTGIHDVFPPDDIDNDDPISEKKLKEGEGIYSTKITLLGFNFNGEEKTMWLEEAKQSNPISQHKTQKGRYQTQTWKWQAYLCYGL